MNQIHISVVPKWYYSVPKFAFDQTKYVCTTNSHMDYQISLWIWFRFGVQKIGAKMRCPNSYFGELNVYFWCTEFILWCTNVCIWPNQIYLIKILLWLPNLRFVRSQNELYKERVQLIHYPNCYQMTRKSHPTIRGKWN